MRIEILAVGRSRDDAIDELVERYRRRIPWKIRLRELEVRRAVDPVRRRDVEGALLHAALPSGAFAIALDEGGEELESRRFARRLDELGGRNGTLAFLIGGADGLAASLRAQCRWQLSLGRMTWPHLLVRVMLMEQLFRAWSILHHHPYHREG